MARPRKNPLDLNADNFTKLLTQKAKIEKEITKQQKKLETVKNDLKGFKKLVDELTK